MTLDQAIRKRIKMSNYIMNRESLKQHCELMCEKFKGVPTSGAYGEHSLVLDLLKQTEWIPVSERLPKESSDYCLCCDKDGYMTIGYISKWSKEWVFDDDEADIDVIAWMPLPEPYKTESEDN